MDAAPLIRRTCWIAIAAGLLAFASRSSAQTKVVPGRPYGSGIGVGVGVGYGYPWGYGFGPWWGYPGGYNGFYSNGFSMYGPPVPTYGAIPGTFGGSDQRIDAFRGKFPPNWPYNSTYIPLNAPPLVAPPTGHLETSRIDVHLPVPDAEVTFDGRDGGSTGPVRSFRTSPLTVGPLYQFEVVARWKAGEQLVERRETIQFKAGQRVRVVFEPTEARQPLPPPRPLPDDVKGEPTTGPILK